MRKEKSDMLLIIIIVIILWAITAMFMTNAKVNNYSTNIIEMKNCVQVDNPIENNIWHCEKREK